MSALSKLRWHCRRGVKELDIVLSHYLDFHYENANKHEQNAFEKLLENEDPHLFALLMKDIEADDSNQQSVLDKLRNMKSVPEFNSGEKHK